MDCISPCPTGSIDNWRTVPVIDAYSLEAQLGWDELPSELTSERLADAGVTADAAPEPLPAAPSPAAAMGDEASPTAPTTARRSRLGRQRMPTPICTGPRRPRSRSPRRSSATCVSPQVGKEYDTHHIMLDFGTDALSGARRAVDRHHPAGQRRQGPHPPPAPVLDRQPAQRRAAGLQQPLADHQARARGPPGKSGARRREQLHVRSEGRRQGAGGRPLRRQLPDAQPPAVTS